MDGNNENIVKWLEEELSDVEDNLDKSCSDVEPEDLEVPVILEDCESDDCLQVSSSDEQSADGQPEGGFSTQGFSVSRMSVEEFSSEDEVPLSQLQTRNRNYFGKNRFRWSSVPIASRTRTQRHNIVSQAQGLKSAYHDILNDSTTPLDLWSLLFTDEMLGNIVIHTNDKIRQLRPKYKKQGCVHDVDLIELKAFIGFLFYTAIFKENREHYTSWYSSDGSGRDIYRCILSKNRFEILMKAIRFDDAGTRTQRRETDISAPIAELFSSFIQNCQKVYSIGTCACIDEMLVAFRGRCRFRMFMPKKPAKYGLKIMCLADARNGYLLNAYIYLGKDSDGTNLTPEQTRFSKPTQAVLRLISPIEGSNRNITADNWFCSVELVDVLKDKKLSLVGTLKKNKKEIPPEFKPNRRRDIGTSVFGFTKNITLTSFVPRKNSAVVLISSMHHTANVDDNTKKPEIILYYNDTKIGVDLLDQRCSNYSTARRTQRWPMCIFYRLLDISASNTYVMSLQNQAKKTGSRFKFIKQLAEELTRPHMKRRENNQHTPRDIKTSIRRILKIEDEFPTVSGADHLETRKTCSTCDPKKKRKTFHLCFICKKPICVECSNKMCKNCLEKL